MARRRPLFFLADVVAIIALCGLFLALMRPPWQSANTAGILFLIWLLVVVWKMFRILREAPSCAECGRRFVAREQIASPALCPQCGQPRPRPRPGRSSKALVISFWAVLGLLLLAGVLTLLLSLDLVRSPRALASWDALGSALHSWFVLLLVLFSVLLIARFLVESAGVKPGPCEKCGSIKRPKGATGPLICPRCRLRHLPKEQLRKQQAKGIWIILCLLLIVGSFVGFVMTNLLSSHLGMNYWLALPLLILATMVGLPVVLIAVLTTRFLVRTIRLRAEPYILKSARKAAGEEGEVVRSGPAVVWYSGPTNPAPRLMEQMEATRSLLASHLGRDLDSQLPLRILSFRKRTAFRAFLKPTLAHLLYWLESKDGIYFPRPHHILAICTEEAPHTVLDLDNTIDTLLCHHFFTEESPGKPRAAWLRAGFTNTLTSDRDARARLNRKMFASLSRRSVLGNDLFKHTDKEVLKLLKGWRDHPNFAKLEQFSAESWSVCEYLGGDQAPAERRECFRAFLNDSQSSAQPDEAFERHFGFGLGRLFECWREWVQEQADYPFTPLRPIIRDGLMNRLIPLIEDRQAKREDRILAIRNLGSQGYVLGADALVALLQGDDAIPREEVVWALEAISGQVYGEDQDRWADWWGHLPAEIREARRQHEKEALTAPLARG